MDRVQKREYILLQNHKRYDADSLGYPKLGFYFIPGKGKNGRLIIYHNENGEKILLEEFLEFVPGSRVQNKGSAREPVWAEVFIGSMHHQLRKALE